MRLIFIILKYFFAIYIFRSSNGNCCLICTSSYFPQCAPYSTHLSWEKCCSSSRVNTFRYGLSIRCLSFVMLHVFVVTGQQCTVHSTSVLWWRLGMEIVFFWKKQSFTHLLAKVLQLSWLISISATSRFPQPDGGSRWIFRSSWYIFSFFPIC